MSIHTIIRQRNILFMQRGRYYVFLMILLILLIFLPAVSFADADKIFKENSKAVVAVIAYDEKGNAIGQGSGFIVRADGAVVTNYHLISMARDIKIKKRDKVFDVEGLIFIDKENNLVVLKAKANGLPVVKLGDIEKADMPKEVYIIISCPEGLEVRARRYGLLHIEKIGQKREILRILITPTENTPLPKISGSPVLNENGEVIGVVIAPLVKAYDFRWVFAMPVNLIAGKVGSKMVTAIEEAGLEDFEKTASYWIVHYIRGNNHIVLGRHKEAIEEFKQAIRMKPDFAGAHNDLGLAYSKSGMYKEAIEEFKQAIGIWPDSAMPHYNLGTTYLKLNDRGSAFQEHEVLKSLDPELANVLSNKIYRVIQGID